jgi:ferritin-like protein
MTARTSLLTGIEADEVVEGLDRLRSSHLVSMHWAQTVRDRLEGQALFLLDDELQEVAEEALEAANTLGERIADLDGVATGDPTLLVGRSLLDGFELPDSYADVRPIMRIGITHVRGLIRGYGGLLEKTRNHDEVSHRLLLRLVAQQVRREADLEGAQAPEE